MKSKIWTCVAAMKRSAKITLVLCFLAVSMLYAQSVVAQEKPLENQEQRYRDDRGDGQRGQECHWAAP